MIITDLVKKYFKLFLNVLLICLPGVGWLLLAMWHSNERLKRIEGGREAIYEKIRQHPTEANVNELVGYCKAHKVTNHPQYWNELRGIWFIINESPNITTEQKYSVRDFLMTSGLRITGSDKNVIKNYNKV